MNVQSRAHRILKGLCNYRDLSQGSNAVDLDELDLKKGEELIGLYENIPGSLEKTIVVTGLGLHIRQRRQWQFIDYDEIGSSGVPSDDKHKADHILVTLNNGREEMVPVEGGRDRFRDAFEFLHFLDRVAEDHRLSRAS